MKGGTVHPVIDELLGRLRRGTIGRREFLRSATVLGVAAAAAYALADGIMGRPMSAPARAATPRKGGVLRCSMNIKEIADPALYDWSEKSNVARHVIEPLVILGGDNLVRPNLAEGWEASADLKTWTFRLRKGVKWSNGDEFGADDVIFNFTRWLDPKTGSSNLGRFSSMVTATDTGKKDEKGKPVISRSMTEGAIEKLDPHTVRFHLNTPDLAMPYSMSDYPALIVHHRFAEAGGDFGKNPVGTGPFALKEIKVGEKAVLVRRPEPYWGGDVFLDGITYIDHGDDPTAQVAAFASGQVDINHQTSIEQVAAMKKLPGIKLHEAVTATTGVARMKVTEKPFDDPRVREAIRISVDHRRMLDLVYQGYGAPGEDHHVAPIHPEYARLPEVKTDPARAKALLAEAGHPNGIKLSIDCVANPPWEQNAVKALAEMVKPAGIELAINVMPGATYWDRWLTTPFGFTSWAHRPLGVQVLSLAYRTGVPWNETSYADAAFDKLLDQAGAALDNEERRKIMAKLEGMLQQASVIVQPLWRSVFVTASERVMGFEIHVALEHHYNKVWLA